MQFKEAAYVILKESSEPLHYREIASRALRKNLLETAGRTPEASMGALLYTDTIKPASQGEEKKPDVPTAQPKQEDSSPKNGQDVQKTLTQQQNQRLHKAMNRGKQKHGGTAHKKGHTHKNTRSRKGGRK